MATLQNPVLMAASMGLADLVMAILERKTTPKIDLSELDAKGSSAIGLLIQHPCPQSDAAIVRLMELGAPFNVDEPDGGHGAKSSASRESIPLFQMALRRHSRAWQILGGQLGSAAVKKMSRSRPLLHEALRRGNHDAAQFLIAAGANPNQEDQAMGLPIVLCSAPSTFAMLVAAGAMLSKPGQSGKTPLEMISSSNHSSEIILMATRAAEFESRGLTATFHEGQLIRQGKAVDAVAQPLAEALFDAIEKKRQHRIKELWTALGLGRDTRRLLSLRDGLGRSLLHVAIEARSFPLARKLLARGMDVNAFDHKNRTPLTILLGLPHDYTERDRSGERRARLARDFLDKADWSCSSPAGSSMFESLFAVGIEPRNGVVVSEIYESSLAAAGGWIAPRPKAKSSLLVGCIERLLENRFYIDNTFFQLLSSREGGFAEFVISQASLPEFSASDARAVLDACCGARRAEGFESRQRQLLALCAAIAQNIGLFKSKGALSSDIDWPSSIANASPELWAVIENWRLDDSLAPAPASSSRRSRAL